MSPHFSTSRPLNTGSLDPKASPLVQSRETGEIIPERKDDVAAIVEARQSLVKKSWAHFVAGATGGMTAAFVTNPLDVLKTRLQSDFYQAQLAATREARGIPPPATLSVSRGAALHVRETFSILFAIPRVEGWRALFKGLGPSLVGVVPARAINFYVYGNGKRILSHYANEGREAAWVHLLAAASAGVVTGTATCPIWVVKTRLQLDRSRAEKIGSEHMRRYRNAVDCTLQTVRQEGIKGLYRGLTASYLGVAESTLQWMLYEQMKQSLALREERISREGRKRSIWDSTVSWTGKTGAAGAAKFIAAIVTYPHEVLRTRLRQAPLANGQLKYTGLVQCTSLIWKEEGIAAFYGGLIPHMLRAVPSAAIMFGVYEGMLKLFGTDSGV